VRGTLQDITDRKRCEREIHFQAHLLDAVDVAVIATDLAGTVTHFNHAAERVYGWTREEAVGRAVTALTAGPETGDVGAAMMAAVREHGQWEGDFEVRRKDGTRFAAYVRTALVRGVDGEPQGAVGVSVDITHRVESERRLRAARDYLRAITDSMGEGLYAVDTDCRLIYMNRAAEKMLGWTTDDLVGREMHALIHSRRPDGTPLAAEDCPLAVARREGRTVRADDEVFLRKDGIGLPVEITSAPFETEDGVRGSVVVFSDITERKAAECRLRHRVESQSWVTRIREALADDRLVLHAQPIVDLATGETVQHELLIRMRDADGALVEPGAFLPAAEESGLIVDIDRFVVRQAIELAARGHAVELNLSARSLAHSRLLDDFRGHLARTGADPSLIVVELTETALLEVGEAGELFIERIKAFGCKLALDDFGTGYGGFTYLKRLPVDYLKIDTEFVRDLPDNSASEQVVRAVVGLAQGFGQRTVAEGVEDARTVAMLRELGVDFGQGFVFARPRPVDLVLRG
jgi:PAS domain S-box-containing protein